MIWHISGRDELTHFQRPVQKQFPRIVFYFYEAPNHTWLEVKQINRCAVCHSVRFHCIVVLTFCYGSHLPLGSAGWNDCTAYLGRLLCCCWNSTLLHTNLSHYYDKSNLSVRLADQLGLCSCFSWQTRADIIVLKKSLWLPPHFRLTLKYDLIHMEIDLSVYSKTLLLLKMVFWLVYLFVHNCNFQKEEIKIFLI